MQQHVIHQRSGGSTMCFAPSQQRGQGPFLPCLGRSKRLTAARPTRVILPVATTRRWPVALRCRCRPLFAKDIGSSPALGTTSWLFPQRNVGFRKPQDDQSGDLVMIFFSEESSGCAADAGSSSEFAGAQWAVPKHQIQARPIEQHLGPKQVEPNENGLKSEAEDLKL